MSLFPDARFTVLLPATGVIPGTQVEGTLELAVPAEIPRAERIDLFFRTIARVHYTNNNMNDFERALFIKPLRVKLDRTRPLPAGTHSYPFVIDVPPWLPPAYAGAHCSIKHSIDVRLDVDWAIDPTTAVIPTVVMVPVEAESHGITTRSPPGFHESLVIDVTVEQSTVEHGEPLSGAIALRAGHDARFEAIEVAFVSVATMAMAQGERRRGTGMMARIPADRLRTGESQHFRLRYPPDVPPTFRTGFIDHDLVLAVDLKMAWSYGGAFEIPLRVVPAGSTIQRRTTGTTPVGSERLARLAAVVAEETGFARGRLPVLARGNVGPVGVQIADGPREGRIGLDIEMDLPDLELGIVYRPLGVLEGFRQSPLLPPGLASSHFLRVEPARAEGGEIPYPVSETALAAVFGELLSDLESRNEVRISDHHFGFHLVLRADGSQDLIECARWTKGRAAAIVRAIGALPFPPIHPNAEKAWRATAAEQNAFLLPHIPALHGLKIVSRVMGGEVRELGVTLRTRKDQTLSADLDLGASPLPTGANIAMATAVTAVFPRFSVHGPDKVTVEGAAFVPDPRVLLGTFETFLAWLLETRGEKRAESPYR